MARCWADHSLVDKATELYTKSSADDKIRDSLKEILANTEGTHGKNKVLFKDVLKEEELAKYKERMYNIYKACDDETIDIKHFFIGVLKAMNILDDFFIRREKEKDDMRGM